MNDDCQNRRRRKDNSFEKRICDTFKKLGIVVLPDFLNSKVVDFLRKDCAHMVEKIGGKHCLLTRYGCVLEPKNMVAPTELESLSTHKDYMILRHILGLHKATSTYLFSAQILRIVELLLNVDQCYLLNENFIVKPAQCNGNTTAFDWHQDAERITSCVKNNAYVSVWCALDNMTENNGCLIVPANGGRAQSLQTLDTLDIVPLTVSAGSVVIIDHDSWHCSLPNKGTSQRRAWMPQFSKLPLTDSNMSIPCPVANS